MTRNPRRIRVTITVLWLTTAMVSGPTNAPAGDGLAAIDAFHVGRLHLADGKHDQALEAFNDSLRLNPQFVQAYLARGKLLAEMGRHSSALADLNFALHMQPISAEGYAYRGYVKLSTNCPEEALADFDQALKLDPSYARVHFLRGETLHVVGRHADAEAETATALRLDPTLATVRPAAASNTSDGFQLVRAAPTLPERTSVMAPPELASQSTDRRAGNVIRFDRHPSLASLAPPAVSQPQARELPGVPSSPSPAARTARSLPTLPRSAAAQPRHDALQPKPAPTAEPASVPVTEQAVVVTPPPAEAEQPVVVEAPLPEPVAAVEIASPVPVPHVAPVVVLPSLEPTIIHDEPSSAAALLEGAASNSVALEKPTAEVSAQRIESALAAAKQAATERRPAALAADEPSPLAPLTVAEDGAADDMVTVVPPSVVETAQVASSSLPDATPSADATPNELTQLDDAVRENPGDVNLRCRRGLMRLEQELFAAAAADFDEALKADPRRTVARYGRARAKYLAGRWDDAVADYNEVLRNDDQHAAALIERGHCFAQLGRPAEASRDREAALALDPSLAKTGPKYDMVVAASAVASDEPTASAPIPVTIEGALPRRAPAVAVAAPTLESRSAPAAVMIGDSESASTTVLAAAPAAKMFESAVRDLSDELQKTPGDARLYELRAQALLALGRAEDAADDLTAAVRIDPSSSKALRLRSRVYETLGRTDEAGADRRRAQELAPATP